jgi:integrase
MTTPKKIRESEGGGAIIRGKPYIRVTDRANHRTAQLAPWATSLEQVQERGKMVQAFVNRLRKAGAVEFITTIIEVGAAADGEELAELATKVDALTAGAFDRVVPKKKAGGTTFGDFAYQWVKGELATLYPDHVERKRSAYTDLCNLRKYVFPVVEDLPIADVTLEHYEQVMREIATRAGKRKLRSATRRHVAQVMRRVMQLAEYPAKLVHRNPIPANAMPRVKLEVALQYIYPDEDAALVGCTERDEHGKAKVDLGRRVLYGFLTRAGWRREEALGGRVEEVEDAVEDDAQKLEEVPALTWRRLDLRHAVVHLDREKTGRPRPVPIDADLVRALEAWRTLSPKSKDDDLVFVDMTGTAIERHDAADVLRTDLMAAKVDRVELHDTTSPMRRPVRLHDLRASMVSIGLANGRTEDDIRKRTGHTSSALERYRRVASTLRELTLGDWSPLDLAIPELAAARVEIDAAAVAAAASSAPSAAASPENAAAHAAAASKQPTRGRVKTPVIPRGRGDWIRTSDPLTPSQVR